MASTTLAKLTGGVGPASFGSLAAHIRRPLTHQSKRGFGTSVHLSVWCESPQAVAAGTELFSRFSQLAAPTRDNASTTKEGTSCFSRVHLDENTVVDLVAPPGVSRRRRFLFRKNGGARLVEVAVSDKPLGNAPSEDESIDRIHKLVSQSNLVYQDSPSFLPHIRLDVSRPDRSAVDNSGKGQTNNGNDGSYVREVVIGVGEETTRFDAILDQLSASAKNVGPFLYSITDRTFLRILPSSYSALVFSVPDLEVERSKSEQERIFLGRIGATGSNQGQFHITSKDPEHLRGLDIRMCGNRGMPSPMFAESNESTYEGSIHMPSGHGDVSCRGRTAMEGVSRMKRVWSNLGWT